MKKILFMVPVMLCGGVEKSLISLIEELPKNEYEITVYLLKDQGELKNELPSYVKLKILPIQTYIENGLAIGGNKFAIKNSIYEKKYLRFIKIICRNFWIKDSFAELKINFEEIQKLNDEYDIAVCYHMHSPFALRYVAEKIQAKVKIAWIHNEFIKTKYDIKKLKKYLSLYNWYFAVSNQLLDEFNSIFPEYKSKSMIFKNIISRNSILNSLNKGYIAEYENSNKNSFIKILTVGRLERQKGYDIAINVCKKLKEDGIRIKWIVLGEGSERKKLQKRIKKLNLQKEFLLVGNKINPYPYINECDIYVQPSRHEGFGIAVAEAKILCKPIVFTDVAGAREQLINNNNGLIVQINEDSIYNAIKELIINESLRNKLICNLKRETYEVSQEIYKLNRSM